MLLNFIREKLGYFFSLHGWGNHARISGHGNGKINAVPLTKIYHVDVT